jgi:hypothetical protein
MAGVAQRVIEELDAAGFAVVPKHPTNRMLKAAAKAMMPAYRPTQMWVGCKEKHRIRYAAMIAAWKESIR